MLPFATNFMGPNGTPLTVFNPGFQNVQGAMRIESNRAVGDSGVTDMVAWGGDAFQPAQYAQGRISGLSGGVYAGVGVCGGAAGSGDFVGFYGDTSMAFLTRFLGGAFTVLASLGGAIFDGNLLRLEFDAGIYTAYIDGVVWAPGPIADGALAGGRGGVVGFGSTGLTGLTDFETGDLYPAAAGGFFTMGVF